MRSKKGVWYLWWKVLSECLLIVSLVHIGCRKDRIYDGFANHIKQHCLDKCMEREESIDSMVECNGICRMCFSDINVISGKYIEKVMFLNVYGNRCDTSDVEEFSSRFCPSVSLSDVFSWMNTTVYWAFIDSSGTVYCEQKRYPISDFSSEDLYIFLDFSSCYDSITIHDCFEVSYDKPIIRIKHLWRGRD